MAVHEGHRARKRQRFLEEGLDGFEKHEVLELLLYYCVTRKDTNELAHRLLNEFGDIPDILSADRKELQRIEGVGESVSTFLSFMNEFLRYYEVRKKASGPQSLTSVFECGEYLKPRFLSRRNEVVFILCLDAKCKVLGCKMIGEGSVNSAAVPIRRIVEVALNMNATTVILAHNHPSGVALPSNEDVQTTRLVANALRSVDVLLADHMIFSDDEYISMRQSNYFVGEDVLCNL